MQIRGHFPGGSAVEKQIKRPIYICKTFPRKAVFHVRDFIPM